MLGSRHRQALAIIAVVMSLTTAGTATAAQATKAGMATSPTAPFTQCPAIGHSPSCEILLVVNSDKTVSVLGDPSVGPFDGNDDTLVGIVNYSADPVSAVTVSGPGSGLSEFDGDGICSSGYGPWSGSAGCPYGTTGYEGPGTSFVTNASLPDAAEVDFAKGLAPGASAYFSLEGALTSARLSAREGHLGFTVSGSLPVSVSGNQSQDTHAQDPAAKCNVALFAMAESLGQEVAKHFFLSGDPASSLLLYHFLAGDGTPIDFKPGSPTLLGSLISNEARLSSAFKKVDHVVQGEVLSELNAGITNVQLRADQLSTVNFSLLGSLPFTDLYFGWRGTQGLDVSGSGNVVNGNYVGTLTYVIRDSYGFTKNDKFLQVGTAMRYLQTVCGNPPFRLGARWFPDSITVTVPFSHPVSQPQVAHGRDHLPS
jgi:hypothetical protein